MKRLYKKKSWKMRAFCFFTLLICIVYGGEVTKERVYEVKWYNQNATAESDRLLAQVDMFWDSESEFMIPEYIRDGDVILEIACGPGHFSEKLL